MSRTHKYEEKKRKRKNKAAINRNVCSLLNFIDCHILYIYVVSKLLQTTYYNQLWKEHIL